MLVPAEHEFLGLYPVTSSHSSSTAPTVINDKDDISPRKTEPSSSIGDNAGSLTSRKQQSQMLDRWAARQAREMITTIERQAYEAEISALTTTTQPVSARAASFLRDTSPALYDTSAAPASDPTPAPAPSKASGCSSSDLPPNLRASSLIQMWRELEAEAGISPNNHTTSAGSNSGFAATMAKEPSSGSDVCDDSDVIGDWDSDVAMTTAHSSTSESERGRVESIVKMLSAANAMPGSEDLEPLSWEGSGVRNHEETQNLRSVVSSGAGLWHVTGRREMEDFLAKLEQEQRRELAAMVVQQPVSRFLHRGRLQVSCSTVLKNDS